MKSTLLKSLADVMPEALLDGRPPDDVVLHVPGRVTAVFVNVVGLNHAAEDAGERANEAAETVDRITRRFGAGIQQFMVDDAQLKFIVTEGDLVNALSLDDVAVVAGNAGFETDRRVEMPANNLSLVFRRMAGGG